MTDAGIVAGPAFDARAFLRSASQRPGVYRMFDAQQRILYVGKARNLRNRLASYFRGTPSSLKTAALVRQIADIQVTVTDSDTEALLLEQQLIKQLRPPYNILLRDDKSFPYIRVTVQDAFPRVTFHRGSRRAPGRYFGPFPSAVAVRETLAMLEKVFRVRTCEDAFFRNRSRPCLQYQIHRCSGPCVGRVAPDEYAADVRRLLAFLDGRVDDVSRELVAGMERAAAELRFEEAAQWRDRIAFIRQVQASQAVVREEGDLDVLAVAEQPGGVCVAILFVRGGRVLGSRHYFPGGIADNGPAAVLSAFLPQFYLGDGGADVPREVILPCNFEEADTLAAVLGERAGRKVRFADNVRGTRQQWLTMAHNNASHALSAHLASRQSLGARFSALTDALGLPAEPERIECFDISHTMGEGTVASCVVFDADGASKRAYRRFNIEDVAAGDDYAAMEQAFRRRYTRLKEDGAPLPDLVLIDGGAGQLARSLAVAEELQLEGVQLVGVSKGPSRRAGLELLHIPGRKQALQLPADHPGLLLVQQVRDEAHRFAIAGHRARRGKARRESPLEGVRGIGPRRRRELLNHFGGWQSLANAGIADLSRVPGINQRLAEEIYRALHPD